MMPAPIDISYAARRRSFGNGLNSFENRQSVGVSSWLKDDLMAMVSPPAATPSLSSSYLPRLEASFCKDFTCCGKHHNNLHDLLSHFESHPPSPPPLQNYAYRNPINEAVSTSDVFGEVEMADAHMEEVNPMDFDAIETIEDPGRRLFVVSSPRDDRPYRCKVIGCDKAYKNQNGLKYHKKNGHVNQTLTPNPDGTLSVVNSAAASPAPSAPSSPVLQNLPSPTDSEPRNVGGFVTANPITGERPEKPYACNACGKRYKNLNGLKYHRLHATH